MCPPSMIAGIAERCALEEVVTMWPQRVVRCNEPSLSTVGHAACWQDGKVLHAEVLAKRLVLLERFAHFDRPLALVRHGACIWLHALAYVGHTCGVTGDFVESLGLWLGLGGG